MITRRTILVTGGNRGLGRAIVEQLAHNQDDLILLGCRDIPMGKKIAEQTGSNIVPVKMDVSSSEKLQNCIAKIYQDYSRIDVLFNNAGVNDKKHYLDITLTQFEETLRVNTIAPFELIKAVIPSMIQNKYGRIINISSRSGSFASNMPSMSLSYSISKTSLNSITFYLAKEFPEYIKINCICPGGIRTQMNENGKGSPKESAHTAIWLANLDDDGPSGKFFFRDKTEIGW